MWQTKRGCKAFQKMIPSVRVLQLLIWIVFNAYLVSDPGYFHKYLVLINMIEISWCLNWFFHLRSRNSWQLINCKRCFIILVKKLQTGDIIDIIFRSLFQMYLHYYVLNVLFH
jgi:hypothetical protein